MKGMSDNFILKDGLIMNKCKVQEIKKANKISYGYSKIKRNCIFKTNWEKIISLTKNTNGNEYNVEKRRNLQKLYWTMVENLLLRMN